MSQRADRPPFVAFAALALLVAGLLLVLRPLESEYLDLVRQGDAHAERAERTAAAAAYREAAHLRPDDALPHLQLARLYLDWRRIDQALDALSEAERLGAPLVDVERLRVTAHLARAETAVTVRPAHWELVGHHARWLLTLDPGDQDARHVLARAYLGVRAWEAARSVYEVLLDRDPSDTLARQQLGGLLLGDDTLAHRHLYAAGTELSGRLLAAFQEAHATGDPAYVNTVVGRVLVEHDEWPLAARQLDRALSHNPAYGDAHAYLGHALDRMGYPEEARSHLRRAVAAMPQSVIAHTFLGLHYDRLGDTAAARTQYEMAYDLAPQNPAICVEIGQTWSAEGRYVAAEIWLREAVSLSPNDPGLWEILARFYLDHNIASQDRAVEAAETLLALAPDAAAAHDLRAWAALQVGDYETAEEHLRRSMELDSQLASAHYHLGLLRSGQGRRGEAEEAFTRAIDLDTTGEFVPLVDRATADHE
ncbi:MAG: tetratricopeptide repeat protein [Anaerolineae bacterium]